MFGSSERSNSVPKMAGSTADQSSAAASFQYPDLFQGQLDRVDLPEQPAVEVRDHFIPGIAAGVHSLQQLTSLHEEPGGLTCPEIDHPREHPVRQQPDVLGKQAKQELDEIVRGAGWIDAALVHADRDLAEAPGRLLRHGRSGNAGLEPLRVLEDAAELRLVLRLGAGGEVNRVDLLDRAGEVGVNLDDVEIGDDQQGGFSRSSLY